MYDNESLYAIDNARGHVLGLETRQVRAWAISSLTGGHDVSWATLAKKADIPTGTLTMQCAKNNIDAKIIINLSRKYKKDPLKELSKFSGYESLVLNYPQPSTRELLTQIPLNYIFSEITARLKESDRSEILLKEWGGDRAFAAWIGLTGYDYGSTIRKVLNISEQSASRKVNMAQFKVDQIIPVSESLGVNPKMALLILGYISEAEAGIYPLAREKALLGASNDDLVDHIDHILRHVRRRLNIAEQKIKDNSIALKLS